ncbi:Elongator subunit elp2 [Sporothrix stenoceras]|uniref:Elongator complex protein 2 n=1 Tax=Sporothrix stenoceras TaxID=5173 RepID=A0ABR3Z5E0_9PEZI
MAHTAYLAAGANRQTAAADWGADGTLCYGAGVNLAVWRPADENGVSNLLGGHGDEIKAVQHLASDESSGAGYFVSGGDDKTLKLWAVPNTDAKGKTSRCMQTIEEAHAAPINCIAAAKAGVASQTTANGNGSRRIFATGAADYKIKIWALERRTGDETGESPFQIVLLQTIQTTPRYFPLCLALVGLTDGSAGLGSQSWMLASAGTNNRIQIFGGAETGQGVAFELQSTLSGHEGWIRSLDFGWEGTPFASDLLLASASQDKYVRLWRIHQGAVAPPPTASAAAAAAAVGDEEPTVTTATNSNAPSNKAHRVHAGSDDYSVTFEALLLGHEDWIYSARWTSASPSGSGSQSQLRLLTASADNSLAVWEADVASGIWVTTARLGELSKEKGATTATGSVGGFWAGLWSPNGKEVVTLCRTGSWRRWTLSGGAAISEASAEDKTEDQPDARWIQAVGVAGHVAPVTGIAWSRDGAYLLSTSGDQTTRLHAEWTSTPSALSSGSWHEIARPQIHGYDLNCIDSLGASQFVSGADEKLMRVFHEPKTVARLLEKLTGRAAEKSVDALPDAANMPVLGLSNKAVDEEPEELSEAATEQTEGASGADFVDAGATPPPEDVLARNTLWPETEKLYGHGYEISCLAVSHDGSLVASACRASSLNHAVVRLFETAPRWTEVRPPLATHTLTVTRLRFSGDDRFLLSVGRDRQWAVFERQSAPADAATEDSPTPTYILLQNNSKAHTRMILDCAWAPQLPSSTRSVFATAGRDKNVKVWASTETDGVSSFSLATTIPQEHPVTAVDFLWRTSTSETPMFTLAIGTEAGRLSVVSLDAGTLAVASILDVDTSLYLPRAVLQLAWRPSTSTGTDADIETGADMAIAGEDASLRVYRVEGV